MVEDIEITAKHDVNIARYRRYRLDCVRSLLLTALVLRQTRSGSNKNDKYVSAETILVARYAIQYRNESDWRHVCLPFLAE